MHLDNYRIAFVAVALIGILIFSWPTIILIVKAPPGQTFSEIYLLGPNRTLANIPFNIKIGETYSLYLGIGNHMGSLNYYKCYIKLNNGVDPLPNTTTQMPSPSPTLCEYSTFLNDEGSWETPFTFTVKDVDFHNGLANIKGIDINGQNYSISTSSLWNPSKSVYVFVFVFELYSFNTTSSSLEFNNRYVSFNFNMTQ
jgi:uncharacterized membrane protein